MNALILFTWVDFIWISLFAVVNWLAWRAGKRAGIKAEQNNRHQKLVKRYLKEKGHDV